MSRGCPQGSKLAPFLWNLIASSILTYPWECNTHLQAYADDFLFLINVPSRKLLEVRYSDAPMQFDDWVLETPVSKTTAMVFGPGPFVTCLHRFGLCSHDRCVCGAKGDRNHYVTVCPVTKALHFTKPSAENLSTWCENIVQDKRSLARLMNSMKILHERCHDIIMD
ncbi:hypothetical protein AVEN_168071-1 [Araneus ventricosus]|uniref:Reverse transcriptase domain-containing protein n=1 Tax=Araneus ventricosus TaxID=182803 RepID=A0A4Y2VRD5_ARAVE|nr:hypothetical protein AVEN_196699-1 [Araneus ventricosus]GBO27937.1 hypothetical protein AVEN_153101-1 [Araneus ventricosus]GBO27952.1 hypothetical protein AVEN_139075-1 [Araneus ventricosus]GBO27953.1 hypothetical protein AVEN_168071-1 [Araneus ventricosus]